MMGMQLGFDSERVQEKDQGKTELPILTSSIYFIASIDLL